MADKETNAAGAESSQEHIDRALSMIMHYEEVQRIAKELKGISTEHASDSSQTKGKGKE
jgi:hypothetical protein